MRTECSVCRMIKFEGNDSGLTMYRSKPLRTSLGFVGCVVRTGFGTRSLLGCWDLGDISSEKAFFFVDDVDLDGVDGDVVGESTVSSFGE